MADKAITPVDDRRQPAHTTWAWLALLAVIIFASTIRIRLLDVPLERDEGEYAYAGQLILHGILPYQPPSLYKYKLPGIYFLYAAILALFGQTQTGVHLGLLVANVATLVLLFLLVKRLFDALAAVTSAAVYAIISIGTPVLGLSAHGEHFVVPAALGGILLLLGALDSHRRWKLFLSGVLFGCAYLIRQHGAALALFGAFYLLYYQIKRTENPWPTKLSRFAVFCAGGLSPLLATCIVLIAAGVFKTFWFWTFTYARKYLGMMPFDAGMELLFGQLNNIIVPSILVWMLACWGFITLLRHEKLPPQNFFALTFLAFSFLSTCPGLYFREHYFVLLLPAVALLAGAGAAGFRNLFSRIPWLPFPQVLSALVVLLALIVTVYQQHDVFFNLSPYALCRKTYGANPFPESLEIAKYIEKNSSPNDLVAILGSEPQILFYARRRSATGYTDTYELMKKHDFALQMQKEMISEIEKANPRFVVFVTVSVSWVSGMPEANSPKLIFDWFKRYVRQHYYSVGVVDIPFDAPTVYRWDKDAVSYQPQSESSVLVFKRID
jgi:hypothetical protein